MTAEVVGFSPRCDDDAFGLCPLCRRMDGYLNIEKEHFAVCEKCRVKWTIGRGLFSSWRDETLEDWTRNTYRLATYRTVEPYFHPRQQHDGDGDNLPPAA